MQKVLSEEGGVIDDDGLGDERVAGRVVWVKRIERFLFLAYEVHT
jgi:hypothetical protein